MIVIHLFQEADIRIYLATLTALALLTHPAAALPADEIRQRIIAESLASYPGNCPCPYNRDRAGRSCGKRSAYSRPGGRSPICYPEDISRQMVEEYARSRGMSVD